ncbi:MAG: hypothetical protein WCY67_11645 [Acidithiobacillus sp.]
MYFIGSATELLGKGKAQSIFPIPSGKCVADFIKLAEDNGRRIIGCLPSLELNCKTADDLRKRILLFTPSAVLSSLVAASLILTWVTEALKL